MVIGNLALGKFILQKDLYIHVYICLCIRTYLRIYI